MIKALLLATALVSWPIISMAQDDAPTGAPPAATADAALPKIIAKVCLVPMNEKLSDSLKKDFSLVVVYDTPISDEIFIRNLEFESRVEDHGMKAVFLVSTIYQGKKPVTECVSSYGQYNTDAVKKMKETWESKTSSDAPTEEHKDAVPLNPKVPTFKDDNSSDD